MGPSHNMNNILLNDFLFHPTSSWQKQQYFHVYDKQCFSLYWIWEHFTTYCMVFFIGEEMQ